MTNDSVLTIIPARYASSRFPGKPLALLDGKPIIQHVVERARLATARVVVATDDQRIYDCVRDFGAEVVLTSSAHRSGTDRCLEAFAKIGNNEEILINLQGDEPFVSPEQIHTLVSSLTTSGADIATLAEPFAPETTNDELANPNLVKVICSTAGQALYFSRSVIPYIRDERGALCRRHTYYRHIGLYGFRTNILDQLRRLAPSSLEMMESLEQLRWLEAGLRIAVAPTTHATIGIDTPEDLERAINYLNEQAHTTK